MSFYEREKTYIRLLSNKECSVRELSEKLFISEPTVRRDIAILKRKEIVTGKRGIVSLIARYADQRIPLFIRNEENNTEKANIAKRAAEYVKDGNVVMLDASTTAFHLLPHLSMKKNLLIITNGAKTAIEATALGMKTICTGGEMTAESFSYVGRDAEDILKRYNADLAFFSCRGISEDGIVSDNSILENSIRKIMMENSEKSILLCDSAKFGKKYLNTLCRTKDLYAVIMNKTPPHDE